jgi:hypothetical protein
MAMPPPQSKHRKVTMLKTLTIAASVLAAAAIAPAQAFIPSGIQLNGPNLTGSLPASAVTVDPAGLRVVALRLPSGAVFTFGAWLTKPAAAD